MPNLALSLTFANAILLSAAPVDAVWSQEANHDAVRANSYSDSSYRITAFAQNEDERLEIVVTRDASAWVATAWATQGARTWRTTDTACPPLRIALEAFSKFDPLKLGPWSLQNQPPPEAIPSGWLGPSWIVRTVGVAPDWSSFDVEIRGGTGAYSRWAYGTARVVRTCGMEPVRSEQ